MKKYGLFIGEIYYPGQGMDDFISSYASVDEAKAASVEALKIYFEENGGCIWMQIADMETGVPLIAAQYAENGVEWEEVEFDDD